MVPIFFQKKRKKEENIFSRKKIIYQSNLPNIIVILSVAKFLCLDQEHKIQNEKIHLVQQLRPGIKYFLVNLYTILTEFFVISLTCSFFKKDTKVSKFS